MVVALLCGLALLLVQVDSDVRQSALEQLQKQTEADLNRYALSLQQRLDKFKSLPKLLATDLELRLLLLDPASMHRRAAANRHLETVNQDIEAAETYLLDHHGMTLAASNWRKAASFVGGDYEFRPYFKQAMKGESSRYFALGIRSKRRGYYFGHPVRHRGKIIGVVVVKIDLNDIEEDWDSPQTDLLVMDRDGVVYISTEPQWKFHAIAPIPYADRERIMRSQRYGDAGLMPIGFRDETRQDARMRLVSLSTATAKRTFLLQRMSVPDAQFDVVILASTDPVDRKVWEIMALITMIYIAVVLLAMVLLSRQRIAQEREQFKALKVKTLEANEARIRAILDNTQAGLITVDIQGQVLSANYQAEALFGLSLSVFCEHHFDDLLVVATPEFCWKTLHRLVCDQVPIPLLDWEAVRLDHSRFPVEVSVGLLPQSEETALDMQFLITVHDITERKKFELALRDSQAALESRVVARTQDLVAANKKLRDEIQLHKGTQNELIQTAKMAVLGQMSAGINHELNQPLTAIRAYADNAQQFLRLERLEPVAQNLHEIAMLTQRMAKIIHPLKEFSRKTSGASEPVCLTAVKEGAMSIMYGRLQRETVVVAWPERLDHVYVLGDIVRIEQVIVNLLENAIQAMEQSEDKQITMTLAMAQDTVTLRIKDTGPGVIESDHSRMFEPFYTTKQAGQGLGLGLSISQRIVVSMQGSLSVRNHPQGGAEFCLQLPRVQ